MDKILKGLEEFFALHNDEEIYTELKQNGTLVKIIGLYDTYNKKIGRTPSALGQKIINEYNKYQKWNISLRQTFHQNDCGTGEKRGYESALYDTI